MKVRFLAGFLLFLCIQCVTILGSEDFPTLKFEDFNISKPPFGEQEQLHVQGAGESDRRGLKGKHELFHSVKVKGKGTYGAGNEVHHPRANKGASSLSASHFFLYSKAMLHLTLALIGLLMPYFLTGF